MTNVSEYMHENPKEIYIFMPLSMAFRIKLVVAIEESLDRDTRPEPKWPEGWVCSALCSQRSHLCDGEVSGCDPAPESGGGSRLQKCPQEQASSTKIPEEPQKLGVWTTSCSHRRNGLWGTTPSCGDNTIMYMTTAEALTTDAWCRMTCTWRWGSALGKCSRSFWTWSRPSYHWRLQRNWSWITISWLGTPLAWGWERLASPTKVPAGEAPQGTTPLSSP